MMRKKMTTHQQCVFLLELVLDYLCMVADRNICDFLHEKEEEQIPYFKKEILTTLEKIK